MNITTSKLKIIIMQEAKKFLRNSAVDTSAKYVLPAYDLDMHTHDPKTFAPSSDEGKPDPSSFMREAKKAGVYWSDEKIYDFGKFIGFDAFFAAALLPQIVRYDWSFDRALVLSTDDRSALGPFLHAMWSKLRGSNIKDFLKELNLPADGPGVMIYDPGIEPESDDPREVSDVSWLGSNDREFQAKNERWRFLKYLYNARIIRWTGEGFIGPCPLIKKYISNFLS